MFSLIVAILIVVLLVKCIGLVGAKTEEVKQRTKKKHYAERGSVWYPLMDILTGKRAYGNMRSFL